MLGDLLRRSKLGARIRGVLRQDAEEALKPLRKELRKLVRDVEALQATLQETAVRAARGDRASAQLRAMLELNEQQRDRLAALPDLLDERRIQAHVARAIAATPMQAEPFEHIVVDEVLPEDDGHLQEERRLFYVGKVAQLGTFAGWLGAAGDVATAKARPSSPSTASRSCFGRQGTGGPPPPCDRHSTMASIFFSICDPISTTRL